MTSELHSRIAFRLKAVREERRIDQDHVAGALGIKDRQTLSAIELGSRRIKPEELARAADFFDVEIDYFTDPFRLDGEADFSFRAHGVDENVVDEFKSRAGRWIATYRELSAQEGERPSHLSVKLELNSKSSFEDAWDAAEELRRTWRLGDVPAAKLGAAIHENLGALVLYVDAPTGLSGAASRLPGLNSILINRREHAGRRNFDLAHELFHLLTWEALTPRYIEPIVPPRQKGNRREQLADNFASALLMPASVLEKRWNLRSADDDLHVWLNATATWLRVSALALKWRMHNLGHLNERDLAALDDGQLVANGGSLTGDIIPPPFSADFVRRVHAAVESGRLSLRRAAKLLDPRLAEFGQLCHEYQLPLSYES